VRHVKDQAWKNIAQIQIPNTRLKCFSKNIRIKCFEVRMANGNDSPLIGPNMVPKADETRCMAAEGP